MYKRNRLLTWVLCFPSFVDLNERYLSGQQWLIRVQIKTWPWFAFIAPIQEVKWTFIVLWLINCLLDVIFIAAFYRCKLTAENRSKQGFDCWMHTQNNSYFSLFHFESLLSKIYYREGTQVMSLWIRGSSRFRSWACMFLWHKIYAQCSVLLAVLNYTHQGVSCWHLYKDSKTIHYW